MSPLVSALLFACHRAPTPTDTGTEPLTGTVVAAAGKLGYTVTTGRLARVDDRDCCVPGANCWFSNPTAPYLAYALPPAPGQPVPDVGPLTPEGYAPNYHLRTDEALVLLGVVPPEARYFGATSYVGYRFDGAAFSIPRGSTGPTTNLLDLASALGLEAVPPGTPYAVVTSLDRVAEDEAIDVLLASGMDPAAILVDPIPLDLVRPGFTDTADTFAHVLRAAGFADPAAGEAWLDAPGAELLRLTPATERATSSPHPRTPVPLRGSGTNEVGWAVAAADLGDVIRDAWPERLHIETESVPQWVEPYDCIAAGYCAFDTTDRYYAKSSSFTLRDNEFVVAYGVNHERTGKAAFAGLAVNEEEHILEVAALDGVDLVGSARGWLPDDPQVDDLYAVAVARDCAVVPWPAGVPCIEVSSGCPGAEVGEMLFLAYRAYLDPATGTGPNAAELSLDRAVKFFAPFGGVGTPTETGATGATGDTGP